MQVHIETRALQAGMATVIKSLSAKPPMKILEGVYLKAEDNNLLLRCSDLALQIDCNIPATADVKGEAVLPGRLFSEIVRKLDGEISTLKLKGSTMEVMGARAWASIKCLDANDYPDMRVKDAQCSIFIPQRKCKDMIKGTAFAISQDETKVVLTGLLIKISDNMLSMVAIDGFRLAKVCHTLKGRFDDQEYIVPGKSIQEIGRALLDEEEDVNLELSQAHLVIDMGHTKIMSRLLEGNFIKYDSLLPTGHTTRVRVNKSELLESIERAVLLSREGGNNYVRFSINEEGMKIFVNNPIGNLEEEINAHLNGANIEIAFNVKYIYDVLRVIEDEEIFLDMNNNVNPCVLRPTQGDDYYYLILPIRIFA